MDETAGDIARLQRIIDSSAAGAGPAMRENFTHPAWVMSAREFVAFWGTGRMASIATAGRSGSLHAAPLEMRLERGRLLVPTFPLAARLKDHRVRPACAITSWDDAYTVAIVYGVAHVPAGVAGMVMVEVEPERIFAIRAPAGHPAHRPLT